MAKENKNKAFGDELMNLGKSLLVTPSNTPMQKLTVTKSSDKTEETKFTVHIPTDLFNKIREIGFKENRKIKSIFVEALEEFSRKNS